MQLDGMVLGLKAGGENKEEAGNEATAPVQSRGKILFMTVSSVWLS